MKKSFPRTALFGHVLKKSAHLVSGARSLLLVHVWITPHVGHEGPFNALFRRTHGDVTI